jgi:hypothetical protein
VIVSNAGVLTVALPEAGDTWSQLPVTVEAVAVKRAAPPSFEMVTLAVIGAESWTTENGRLAISTLRCAGVAAFTAKFTATVRVEGDASGAVRVIVAE